MTPAPTIHVFTYKDGLLARLAHDLRCLGLPAKDWMPPPA